MHEILPGILEQDWTAIEKKIELVRPFAKKIHIDILDGKFAENTTFLDPKPFKKYSQDVLLELHMMVEEPEGYLEEWGQAGFRRFIGHVEMMTDQPSFVARAEKIGEVGLALDGKTDLDKIKVSYEDLDSVLIMTINAGFSGQTFMPEHLEKVKQLAAKGLFPVEVDGGINEQTLRPALLAGATRFITTSFLFKGEGNLDNQYEKLQKLTNESETV